MHARLIAPVALSDTLSFGATLKRYRRAVGLTQEELAERAGYSVGHVSKLESSARLPVAATIELLADALALNPAERSALERSARRAGGATPHSLEPAQAQGLPPLVGREKEESTIERHLTAEAEPPLLLFAGEPGIGKTRLLQAAAERAVSDGWFVVQGACRRHGAQGPFGSLVEALLGAIRPMSQSQLRAALDGCGWLARLLPELVESGAAPMPTWSLPADQERRLMFAAVGRFLRNVAGPAGTLLLLDNVQWAGADTRALFAALAQAAPQSPLRMIGAYRQNEVGHASPLAALLADLAHERLVVRRVVGPLAPSAAAELLDRLLVGAEQIDEPTRAEALRKAAGSPFVLVSYAQWLRSQPRQEGIAPQRLGIPWDVTQTVEQRVAALPELTRMVVRIAAVSVCDDPRDLLITVARRLGYSELDAITAIDDACEAGLLVQRGGDLYAFTYDLVQEVVERSLGAAQHAYLHRIIAEALEEERIPPSPEALADHYLRAGEPEKALLYLEQAGARAQALHAYADAARYYRLLVEAEPPGGRDGIWEASQVRERLGIMLGYMGLHEEALAELESALEAYRTRGQRDGQARVVALISQVYYAQGEIERGIARLEREARAMSGLADGPLALLYQSLAQLYSASGQFERALDAATRAVEGARASQDDQALALAELERGMALGMLDRLDESLRVLEDAAVPLTSLIGDVWTQAQALDQAAQSRIVRGQFTEAERDIERGLALAWQLDDHLVAGMMLLDRGMLRFYRGAWRRAQADLRWASALLRSQRLTPRAAHASVWLGVLSLAQGRRRRAEVELRRGLVLAEASGDTFAPILAHCASAERDLLDGKPQEARMRLEPLLTRGSRYRLSELTSVLALLGWAYLELDDERQAEALLAASVLRASATGQRCALTDALRIQAMGAAREGRWEDAQAGVTAALTLARELPYPYAEAKALALSGELLLRQQEIERGNTQMALARDILRRLAERLYDERLGVGHLGAL